MRALPCISRCNGEGFNGEGGGAWFYRQISSFARL